LVVRDAEACLGAKFAAVAPGGYDAFLDLSTVRGVVALILCSVKQTTKEKNSAWCS